MILDGYLTPAQRRLFDSLSTRDQHHHLETLRLLAHGGSPSRVLARAALLHDIGKGHIRLYERVAYVLLTAGVPWLLERTTRNEGWGPCGALYRIRHHAATGARWLQQLGADPREVELVAHHHLPPNDDAELRLLIAADDEA